MDSNKRNKLFISVTVAALCLALFLGGCGSSGSSDGPTGPNFVIEGFDDPAIVETYSVLQAGLDSSDGLLRLSETVTAFPFIWVANSSEGTISKLNTVTGAELGRYKTGPGALNGNPSRTTVDLDGNVWVGNRVNNTLTKVGLFEAGNCIDRNENGVIDTSLSTPEDPDVLGWLGSFGDGQGTLQADDECILLHLNLSWPGVSTPTDIRLVAIDPDNNVFVGGYSRNTIFKIRGTDGTILDAVETLQGHYGGVVDRDGNLWSMLSGSGKVEKISNDLQSFELIALGHAGYGITIDNSGKVWTTSFGALFSSFDPLDPVGTLQVYSQTGYASAQGIATDANGDVFIAGSLGSNHVGHYLNDGTFVANYIVGSGPTGVAIDNAGMVWSANINDNSVSRIDLETMQVDSFPVGLGPYNYSDMTGSVVRTVTNPQGLWTATFDSEVANYAWEEISYGLEGDLPEGTGIVIRAKAANEKVAFGGLEYLVIETLDDMVSINGRYLQLEIKLYSDVNGTTPLVRSIEIR